MSCSDLHISNGFELFSNGFKDFKCTGDKLANKLNVQGTDITIERNVHGTDITINGNVQGTDITSESKLELAYKG